jgi:ABC-type lipoprotein release transport system permease subunit
MKTMASKEFKKIILDHLNERLKPIGFKKSGTTFRKVTADMTYFINVQSSRDSTAQTLKTTLNLEIASSTIANNEDTSLPMEHRRHWTARIGFLLDKPIDKWWTINNDIEANEAVKEIIDIIENRALVEFSRLKTTRDLVDLWRSDKCPGLTEKQRVWYLTLADSLKIV